MSTEPDIIGLLTEIAATHEAISTADFDLEAVMSEIVAQACRLTGADGAVVELVDGGDLVCRAGSGAGESRVGSRVGIDESASSRCVQTGETVVESDAEVARVALPLKHHGDEIAGALSVFSSRSNAFGDRELPVLQMLATTLGAAVQRAELLERLLDEATTDELTGLANRRAWEEQAPLELDRAGRASTPVSLAIIDLDEFRAFNEEHGVLAGDRLLVQCASRWNFAVRTVDLIARLGGEEFAVLLPSCAMTDAVEVLDRMREASHDLRTLSAGVAQWDGTETLADLVLRANEALLSAKQQGRDRIVCAD